MHSFGRRESGGDDRDIGGLPEPAVELRRSSHSHRNRPAIDGELWIWAGLFLRSPVRGGSEGGPVGCGAGDGCSFMPVRKDQII